MQQQRFSYYQPILTQPNHRDCIKLTSWSVKIVWMLFSICNQSQIEKVSESVVTRFTSLKTGPLTSKPTSNCHQNLPERMIGKVYRLRAPCSKVRKISSEDRPDPVRIGRTPCRRQDRWIQCIPEIKNWSNLLPPMVQLNVSIL